jgi:hypothetical protein
MASNRRRTVDCAWDGSPQLGGCKSITVPEGTVRVDPSERAAGAERSPHV